MRKNIIMRSQNQAFRQSVLLSWSITRTFKSIVSRWIALTYIFSCELYRRVFSVHQTVSWVCPLQLDWTYGHQTTSPSAEMKTNHIITSLFHTSIIVATWDKNNSITVEEPKSAYSWKKQFAVKIGVVLTHGANKRIPEFWVISIP